jgi:Rrf2 family cysteine metabolism transcriptional repressor
MKVSKRGEYGMRALCCQAGRHEQGWVHVGQIASDEAIPAKFLESILLQLKRAGFVGSRRGNEGGYSLAKAADEIMLGEVVRILDGPLAPMSSARELQDLMERNPRQVGFYSVLMDVRNAVSAIIDRTSLADVVRRSNAGRPEFERDTD